MHTFIIKYEARADKAPEIVEYASFNDVCDYLIRRYREGNPIVIGETNKYILWICDPTLQIHVSMKADNGHDNC